MKLFQHYYLSEDVPIRVNSGTMMPHKREPSKGFIVQEFHNNKWNMACFPEINSIGLRKLKYIGKIAIN